jgi:RND family efflux transporter MFP subunit
MALERAKVAASVDPLDIEIKTLAVEQARLKLIEAQDDLDSATIRAPFDGLIGQVPINVNDTVTGAQLAIRLVDPTQIQVNAFVNEMDIFLVKAGMAATVSVDALASGVKMPATVYAISPYTDPSSGVVNYLVKLKVKVPSNYFAGSGADTGTSLTTATSFKEGLTASVTIIIDEKKSVIIIPNKAVTRPAGSRDSVVQFVKPDGTVEQRVVQTGISSSQNIEIVSGLNEGDRVAVFRTSATPTPGQVRIPRL